MQAGHFNHNPLMSTNVHFDIINPLYPMVLGVIKWETNIPGRTKVILFNNFSQFPKINIKNIH